MDFSNIHNTSRLKYQDTICSPKKREISPPMAKNTPNGSLSFLPFFPSAINDNPTAAPKKYDKATNTSHCPIFGYISAKAAPSQISPSPIPFRLVSKNWAPKNNREMINVCAKDNQETPAIRWSAATNKAAGTITALDIR